MSESVAMVAAIEMLVPWVHRPNLQAMFDQGMDNFEIASEFRVPRHVISNLRDITYSALSNAANEAATR